MYAPTRRKGLSPRAFAGNRRTPTGGNEPSFPGRRHHHRANPKYASDRIPILGRSFQFAPVWGIRPAGGAVGDQKRVATPALAIRNGADYLVVGRPVTQAPDPRAAAEAIVAEIGEAH